MMVNALLQRIVSNNFISFTACNEIFKKAFNNFLNGQLIRFKPALYFAVVLLGGISLPPAQASELPTQPLALIPVPHSVGEKAAQVISLNGIWLRNSSPKDDFWRSDVDTTGWQITEVPSVYKKQDKPNTDQPIVPYAFRKQFKVPLDFRDQQIILRFNGVSNAARVWVNGKFVRKHWGGFMAWTCDITAFVTPGEDALIALEVDDRPEGLAKFTRAGGIQRDVQIFAVPANYITRFKIDTDLDANYRDAILRVQLKMAFNRGDTSRVQLTLRDEKGNSIPLTQNTLTLTRKKEETTAEIPVPSPKKWDAEHPNLYSLEAAIIDNDGKILESVQRMIGFRKVEVRSNRLFVNGSEVKLRGVWGGTVPWVKSVNGNHSRQLWATDELLEEADSSGLYILDEIPVDFAKYGVESDPRYSSQWMSLISELMERDYNHPSIIMWGLANESFHGSNTMAMQNYVKAEDPQRPTMHSWANRIQTDKALPYDIYSSHYPNLMDPALDLGGYSVAKWHSTSLIEQRAPRPSIPVLHDEYSHTVINRALLERDPNARNFWGESIYRFWEKMVSTSGALGGDIFALDWGGPGAPEPELARKAYSPVRITNQPLELPKAGGVLEIPVSNWYDHTNLSETKVEWSVAESHGILSGPHVAPHSNGVIQLPARKWIAGDQVHLSIRDAQGRELDQWLLTLDPPPQTLPIARGPTPQLKQTDREIIVQGKDFRITFNRDKGLIQEGSYKGNTIITDGPFLELLGSGLAVSEWWCDSIEASTEGHEVVVKIRGNYAVIRGGFEIRIDGTGLITTRYSIDYVPGEPPPATFSPWDATSVGGYSEVGISFLLPKDTRALTWDRKGLWSTYPEDHLGRNNGRGVKGSLDFRATKENIYKVTAEVNSVGLTALSDGNTAVRMSDFAGTGALPAGTRMAVLNEWNYPDIGLGNYTKPPLLIRNGYSNTIYVRLSDLKNAKR